MDNNFSGLLTGLSQGLNGYLEKQQDAQTKMGILQQQSALEIQQAKDLEDYKIKNKATFSPEDLGNLFGQVDPSLKDPITQVAANATAKLGRGLTSEEIKTALDPVMTAINSRDIKTTTAAKSKDDAQDKLEKEYADRLQKVVAARSGGLGLQDAKVNQAVDLRTFMNQYYDPKTGDYNIPPAQHSEMALGLARLLSPQGTVPIELEKQLRQSTGREALANVLIYSGMDPATVGGPTQSVIKMFRDSIDRQGATAERLRDQYIQGLKGLAPTDLEQGRIDRLNKAQLTSSFNDLLSKSADHQQPEAKHMGKIPVISPEGKKGYIPAEQLKEALASGYTQGH